ncbi:MAG: lamin tail domain-containing protein, partial [Bacteroidales bacterium]|nr:lamin tail domain-containing protein [Bacteroidales bacterium]
MRVIIFKIIVVLVAILSFTGVAAQEHVVISEVMSSNTKWNYDSDFGAFSDWIELHNPTGSAVDLGGWFLSDDPGNPDKWEIPGNTLLPAGGYLLFWADDRDLVPGQTAYVEFTEVHEITVEEYHLNFRINRDREEVMLVDPALVVVDQISLRDQERDVTFGRQPGNPGQLVYLGEPTPLAENSSYFADSNLWSGHPEFSLPAGMYVGTQELVLQPPADGVTIRYTTNGSEPDSHAPVYTAPLSVHFSQVIKARCYEAGKLPGAVVTASYIIGKDTGLPVLSVSTDHANLWGFDFGLYQNNYKNREIFAHLEYFDAAGKKDFGINAGLQLFGSQIFLFDQKPLSVFFRNRYGQDSLLYPLFQGKPLNTFHSLVLRNGGNDNGLTMFRDGLGAALVEGQAD